ncbi:MAG: N-acetyltransferase [Rhodoferax sp.]|jgi:predicted N-acyltransferase|uniref:GNAT family N-acetyltransferase n=1 Tax=Rhodoferax sp. TaxID=50421 RepID=UPI001B6E76EA|nr:GNAT family N-acetyltransferase [Rhodoferax sp.]MBP8286945.1 N-acetyltransferase [Rhodoferax sp.]MBP9149433.1 N-acetyltransferase [Rhodoferax sp.]MBP9734462.1 N-acetyltransferase [Rhodoferax sp.]
MNDNNTATDADDYVIRVLDSPMAVDLTSWNTLLHTQDVPTPFMRLEYLRALHQTGCANAANGWDPRFFLLERQGVLQAATVLYVKSHSQGEFVFDWGWARAYQQHGLDYHPKAVCGVPFLPVTGSRLLARHDADRELLSLSLLAWCESNGLTGLHALFASPQDVQALTRAGLLTRHTVQFHWCNRAPAYASFDDFLASLSQEKRKKIRQERRKVHDAGVRFEVRRGTEISSADWDFFYRCYERTYLEHGNHPYLSRDFYARMQATMPEDWLLFIATRNGEQIASSLIATNTSSQSAGSLNGSEICTKVAYGRHWGALQRVDCLHFEACYYQPLQWCIDNGYQHFEGGAQGEHKLARALLPVTTTSAHWLAHPEFFAAVDRFLERERAGIDDYVETLHEHSPFKAP